MYLYYAYLFFAIQSQIAKLYNIVYIYQICQYLSNYTLKLQILFGNLRISKKIYIQNLELVPNL